MEEHPNESGPKETTSDISDDPEYFEIPVEEDSEPSEDDLQERLLRLQAEFDNYRKRMDARYSEAARFASEGIILKVLDILDNLQRALEADFHSDPDSALKGIEAIEQQVTKILKQEDVRPIFSVGKPFDTYYQHAVGKENNPDEPDGFVMREYQRGYMIREKVLRPALVVVNRHETSPVEEVDVEQETDSIDKGE